MKEFIEKKHSHFVIKRDDVLNLIPATEAAKLGEVIVAIQDARFNAGKKIHQEYYVVNKDEAYAAEVFEVIKRGESEKVRTCRVCGCDDNHACSGGCLWVEDDLCSQCYDKMHNITIYMREVVYDELNDEFTVPDQTRPILFEEVETRNIAEALIIGHANGAGYESDPLFEDGKTYIEYAAINDLDEIVIQDMYYDLSD